MKYQTIRRDSFRRGGGNTKISNISLIKSVEEYVNYIRYLRRAWKTSTLWFRGVSQSKYHLVPTVYRSRELRGCGPALALEFTRQAKGLSRPEGESFSRWEWYYVMQHHGLPTRLLDWTEGSFIGLYFAIRHIISVKWPSVWVLDPCWLNKEATGDDKIYHSDPLSPKAHLDTIAPYLEEKPRAGSLPVAIRPPCVSPRIRAQQGCFTVHGEVRDGFTIVFRRSVSPRIVQLRFDHRVVRRLHEDLQSTGVSESLLFPDLDGLARHLTWKYDPSM